MQYAQIHSKASGKVLPQRGGFIRVRADQGVHRAGKDGMVVSVNSDGPVLLFGYDRHNEPQHCVCVGPEQWWWDELDTTTLE